MKILSIYETSYKGMYKIQPDFGETFFIRKDYLVKVNFDLLKKDYLLDDEMVNELLDAAFACIVELKAVEYLARQEQSRFGLTQKLLKKNFDKKYVDMALTFLEKANYLSDERFSRAWIHSRFINHYEGKSKIINELLSRGISREIAQKVTDECFLEINEFDICTKAYLKQKKHGKEGEKLIAALLSLGFSYKLIKEVISN